MSADVETAAFLEAFPALKRAVENAREFVLDDPVEQAPVDLVFLEAAVER